MWRDACNDFVFPQSFSQGWTALVRLFDLDLIALDPIGALFHGCPQRHYEGRYESTVNG
jgi:hypothetical protein